MFSQFQIRQSFLDFFAKKGHQIYPSASLVPPASTGLLFTNAGMNSFKDVFCDLEPPPQPPRVVNSQKCMRISGKHNDLEEVGLDTYHHTFFEMLGNWSFADYGKQEAILWAWELLTQVWNIPENRLFVTYYHQDLETASIWKQQVGLSADRVLPFDKKDNFWEMGDVGPCGPCTEIHIYSKPEEPDMSLVCDPLRGVNSGSADFIEIWNLVFIQNLRQRDGSIVKLPKLYVDTGMGLERIVAVLQNKTSNYDTDLFTPLILQISEMSNRAYQNNDQIPMRVIADHIRSICCAISDGIAPSNDGRGYIIRRILRRAFRYGKQLGMEGPFLFKLVPFVGRLLGTVYPRLIEEQQSIQTWILQEETLFDATLSRGLEYFATMCAKEKSLGKTIFSGADAFTLYDTYGFPVDLTGVLCKEQNLQMDQMEFDDCMQKQKVQSAAAGSSNTLYDGYELKPLFCKEQNLQMDQMEFGDCVQKQKVQSAAAGFAQKNSWEAFPTDLGKTLFVEKFLSLPAAKVQYIAELIPKDQACSPEMEKRFLFVFDQTVFYAEGGGQVSDQGTATAECGCSFKVIDVKKIEGACCHIGKLSNVCSNHDFVSIAKPLDESANTLAELTKETFILHCDPVRRRALVRNHTATHLLHQALRDVLGPQVRQKGSLVDVDRLRFDFTVPVTPSDQQLLQVEHLVNLQIESNAKVSVEYTSLEKAKKMGALAFFEERYDKEVRVVKMGDYSIELCGGTHAHFLGEVGAFSIDGIRSIASGVKRIEAKTGPALVQEYQKLRTSQREMAKTLRTSEPNLLVTLENLLLERVFSTDTLDLVYQTFITNFSVSSFVSLAPWLIDPTSPKHFLVSYFPSRFAIQKAVSKYGRPAVKKELLLWCASPPAPRMIISGKESPEAEISSHPLDDPDAIHICWNICPQEARFDFFWINKGGGSDIWNDWLQFYPQAIAKRVAGKFRADCKTSDSLFRIFNIKIDAEKNFSKNVLAEFWKAVEHSVGSTLYAEKDVEKAVEEYVGHYDEEEAWKNFYEKQFIKYGEEFAKKFGDEKDVEEFLKKLEEEKAVKEESVEKDVEKAVEEYMKKFLEEKAVKENFHE